MSVTLCIYDNSGLRRVRPVSCSDREEAERVLAAMCAEKVSYGRTFVIVFNGGTTKHHEPGTGTRSLGEWVELVQATTQGYDPEEVMAVAMACFDKTARGEVTGVWHECAVLRGRLDQCNCYPCAQARKA